LSDGQQLKLKATFSLSSWSFILDLYMSATNSRSLIAPHASLIREDVGGEGNGQHQQRNSASVHLFGDYQFASDGALGVSAFLFFSFHTDEAGVLRGARPYTHGAKSKTGYGLIGEHCASIARALREHWVSAFATAFCFFDSTPNRALDMGFSFDYYGKDDEWYRT
jgi:hypothetical protein